MNPNDEIRELSRQVLGQSWTPHERNTVHFHTLRKREPSTLSVTTKTALPGELFGRLVLRIKSLISRA
jgi:hypothetical protein